MCKHVRATKKRSKSLAKQADFVINNLHNTSIILKCNTQWATTYALPSCRCPPLSSPAGLLSFDFPPIARGIVMCLLFWKTRRMQQIFASA